MTRKIFYVTIVVVLGLGCVVVILFTLYSLPPRQNALVLTLPKEKDTVGYPGAQPLHLALPRKEDAAPVLPKGPVVNLLMMKNDLVFCYNGTEMAKGKTVSLKELGGLLEEKKKSPDSAIFVVVIKPSADASYKSIVNMLNQMLVHDIKRYVMADISNDEQKLVNNILIFSKTTT